MTVPSEKFLLAMRLAWPVLFPGEATQRPAPVPGEDWNRGDDCNRVMEASQNLLLELSTSLKGERREPGNGGPARTAFLAAMRSAWTVLFPGEAATDFRGGDNWNRLVDRLDFIQPDWRGYEVGASLPHQRRNHRRSANG